MYCNRRRLAIYVELVSKPTRFTGTGEFQSMLVFASSLSQQEQRQAQKDGQALRAVGNVFNMIARTHARHVPALCGESADAKYGLWGICAA